MSAAAPSAVIVHGIAYVAVLREGDLYGAKPLAAALLTFRGQDELTWNEFRKAASAVGKDVFCIKAVHLNKTETLDNILYFMSQVVNDAKLRYSEKHPSSPLPAGLPIVLSKQLMTAPQFVKHCISLEYLPPNSTEMCKQKPYPPPSHAQDVGGRAPNSKLSSHPSATTVQQRAPILAPTSSHPSAATVQQRAPILAPISSHPPASTVRERAPILAPTSSTPSAITVQQRAPILAATSSHPSATTVQDPVRAAMEENGLENLVSVPEVKVPSGDGDIEQVEGGGAELEDDRLIEDALEKISALPHSDQQSPAIISLGNTIKTLKGSLAKVKRRNLSLMELTILQDTELKAIKQSSADAIIPGLLPELRKAMSEIKKDVNSEVGDQLEQIKNLIKSEGVSTLTPILEALELTMKGVSAQTNDNNQLVKNAMGAAFKIDWNLSAVGMGVRDPSSPPINIPSILLEIATRLGSRQHSSSSHPTPPSSSLMSSSNPSPSAPPSRFMASSSPSPSAPPRKLKMSKWDPPIMSTPPASLQVSHRSLPAEPKSSSRNLNEQFRVEGNSNNSRGTLFSDMARASNVWAGTEEGSFMSQEEIDQKIRLLSSMKRPRRN